MNHFGLRFSKSWKVVQGWIHTFALAIAISAPALADELIEPKAIDLLERMSQVLAGAKTLQFKAYTLTLMI